MCCVQVSQGKSTTAVSSSPKKAASPLMKKTSSAAAEAADPLAESSSSARGAAGAGLGARPKATGGPKIYTCYMCGQGFSGSSLGIHQPKCQQKWLAEQAAKPAGEGVAETPLFAVFQHFSRLLCDHECVVCIALACITSSATRCGLQSRLPNLHQESWPQVAIQATS